MKKYEFTIGGNSYNVRVKAVQGSVAQVEVNGSSYEVHMNKEVPTTKTPILVRSAPVPTAPKSVAPASGLSKVIAPLPGVMVKVVVKDGDVVKLGDSLFILEAMKMENNILAEKAGTVKNVKVHPGDAVLQGDVILEIE